MPLPLSQAQFPPQSLKKESTVDCSLDKPGPSKLLPRPRPVLGPWTQRWSWCSALRWGGRGGSLGWAALPVLEQLRALAGRHVHGSPRLGDLPGYPWELEEPRGRAFWSGKDVWGDGMFRVLKDRGIGQEDSGEEDGEFWAGRGNLAPWPPATAWLPCALWWSLLGTQISGHLCSDEAHSPLTLAGCPAVLLEVSCLPRHVPGTAPRDSALALASWWRQTADLTTLWLSPRQAAGPVPGTQCPEPSEALGWGGHPTLGGTESQAPRQHRSMGLCESRAWPFPMMPPASASFGQAWGLGETKAVLKEVS